MTNVLDISTTGPSGSSEMLLPRRRLRELIPVSDMTIYRWEQDGIFPKHLSINGRNYWRLSEVRSWIDDQKRTGSHD